MYIVVSKHTNRRTMMRLRTIKPNATNHLPTLLFKPQIFTSSNKIITRTFNTTRGRIKLSTNSSSDGGEKETETRRSFLSLEEAGLVEVSGLSSHERFLCRLTISSLNLLRVISEQEGCAIEELNAGKVCDWFLKDKLKREQNVDSAVLQWDDSEFII